MPATLLLCQDGLLDKICKAGELTSLSGVRREWGFPMLTQFICASCENEVRVNAEDVGGWVACPFCSFVQVAPDAPLALGSAYCGYSIGSFVGASLLAQSYRVSGGGKFQDCSGLMLVPTSFFLKNVSDFNAFAYVAVSGGKTGIAGMSKFVDMSPASGGVFFVYDGMPGSVTLASWIASAGPVDNVAVSKIMRSVALTMGRVWNDFAMPHMNLTPANIWINPAAEVEISGYGLSGHLLRDGALLGKGFSIWDTRFMSPEMRIGHYDFGSPFSDIYSLGATAFFLLTGKAPFEDYSFDGSDPFSDPSLEALAPAPLLQLIRRMTAPSHSERPRSWDELLQSIDAATGGPSRARHHTLRFQTAPAAIPAAKEVSTNSVGLTRMSAKVEKRQAQRKAGASPQEFVARQALAPEQKSGTGRWKSKGSKGAKEAVVESRVRFLVILAIIMFGVAVAIVSVLSSSSKKRAGAQDPSKVYVQGDSALPAAVPQAAAPAAAATAATAPAAPAAPEAKPKAAVPAVPKESKPKGRIAKALAEIDAFIESSPDSFDMAVRKYEDVMNRAQEDRDFLLMEVVQERLHKLLDLKAARVAELMKKLEADAKPLLDASNSEGAAKIYLEYKGPLAYESKAERAEAAARLGHPGAVQEEAQPESKELSVSDLAPAKGESGIEARARKLAAAGRYMDAVDALESYCGPDAAKTESSRRSLAALLRDECAQVSVALDPVFANLVPPLCALDAEKSLEIIAKAAAEPDMKPAAVKVLKALQKDVEAFKSLDPLFLEDLKASEGRSVPLALAGRKPEDFSVLSVKEGSASVKAPSGETLSVSFKSLSVESKAAFASKRFDLEESPLLCAMIGAQSKDKAVVKRALKKLPAGMDLIFASSMKELFAKEEFERMLEAAGLRFAPSDYSQILAQMRKRDFTPRQAETLLASLQELMRKCEGLDFAVRNDALFKEMLKICRGPNGAAPASASGAASVGKESLSKMSMSIQDLVDKAEPSSAIELKKGVYSLPAGVPLVIAKNGIKLVCEDGVEIDGGIKILGSKVSISNIVSREGGLELIGANEAKVENCQFLLAASSIKNSAKVSIENCVFRTLSVSGAKELSLNHCTMPGSPSVKCSLSMMGDDASLANCVIYSQNYALGVPEKSGKARVRISNSLIYGETALCVEVQEGSDAVKKSAKTESEFTRYAKSSKNVFCPAQFVLPGEDFALVKSSPGALKASDGKDCGFLKK